MAWEKLYVAEDGIAFRFFATKLQPSSVPFQFILRGYQESKGDWEAELLQEDPANHEVEILMAKCKWATPYSVTINGVTSVAEKAKGCFPGYENLESQTKEMVSWASIFIDNNYRLDVKAL